MAAQQAWPSLDQACCTLDPIQSGFSQLRGMMSQPTPEPTVSIQNDAIRLEVLKNGGPRLTRLFLQGNGENQLVELPEFGVDTPFGLYRFYGGHRLWAAPEAMPRTYIPDLEGAFVETFPSGVLVTGRVEPGSQLQKSMRISLDGQGAAINLTQTITNCSLWPLRLAPWSLTQLPTGGMAIFPQTEVPVDQPGLLPNRQMTLWPYSHWRDPRFFLDDDLILLHAQPHETPFKLGYFNHRGWMAYHRAGVVLLKRFSPQPGLPHLDLGCNTESYTRDKFIELEILGPECELQPGESTELEERWEYYSDFHITPDISGARDLVARLKPG